MLYFLYRAQQQGCADERQKEEVIKILNNFKVFSVVKYLFFVCFHGKNAVSTNIKARE